MTQGSAPEKVSRGERPVLSVLPKWPDRLLGFVYLNPKYPDESIAEWIAA